MKSSLLVAVVAFALGSSAAFAAGLADKKKWATADKDVKEKVDEAEKACGSKIAVSFDKGSFNDKWNETTSIGGSCGNAAEGLAGVCGKDADSKAAGKKITKINCKAGAAASLKVAGGTLNYVMDYASGGMTGAQVEAELEKQL